MFKRIAAVVITLSLVVGGATVATAQTEEGEGRKGEKPPGQTPKRGPRHGKEGPAGLFHRAVHGELLVRNQDGKYETVQFDRGKVNPDSNGSKIVLDRPDGKQVSFDLTSDTKYKGVENAGQIRENQPAMVVSKGGKALVVMQADPDRKARRRGPPPGPAGNRGNKQPPPTVSQN